MLILIIIFIILGYFFLKLLLTGVIGIFATANFVSESISNSNLQKRINHFFTSTQPDENFVNLGNSLSRKIVVKELNQQQKNEIVSITVKKIMLREVKTPMQNIYLDLANGKQEILTPHKIYSHFDINIDLENLSNKVINIEHIKTLAVNNLQEQGSLVKLSGFNENIMPNAIVSLNYAFLFNSSAENVKEIKILIPTIDEYITIKLNEEK